MEGKDKDKKYIKFKGTVIRDVYTSERFSVYAMDVDANKYPEPQVNKFNNVSICGEIPALTKGVEYEVVGAEEEGKNGISYRVYSIRRDEPLTKQGVRSFLEEITSPNLAYVISEAYPDIIERVKKDRLDDIDFSKMHGVGEKNFEVIVNKINDNFYLSDLAAEFGGILTTNMLRRIYAKYKSVDLLKEKLKKAPYSTLTKVSGIGFKTADDKIIAMQDEGILDFGFDIKTSTDRCLSCIVYLLKQNEDNEGNTKMNLVELRKQVINMTPHVPIDSPKLSQMIPYTTIKIGWRLPFARRMIGSRISQTRYSIIFIMTTYGSVMLRSIGTLETLTLAMNS